MTDLVVRTVPGDQHGYRTVTATWRPAHPGDTPGGLVPEHGPTQPVDLTTRPRELLDLKGPCSNTRCRLHYTHSGPCDCTGESED